MSAVEKTYRNRSVFAHRKDVLAVNDRQQPYAARSKANAALNEHNREHSGISPQISERGAQSAVCSSLLSFRMLGRACCRKPFNNCGGDEKRRGVDDKCG